MAAYATVEDVEKRILRELSETEESVCSVLLDDAAVIIDAFNKNAGADAKLTVSCRMVIRALDDGSTNDIPLGATQGSMSGLSYSQSWTIGGGEVPENCISAKSKRNCSDIATKSAHTHPSRA